MINAEYTEALSDILRGTYIQDLPEIEKRAGLKWDFWRRGTDEVALIEAAWRINRYNHTGSYRAFGMLDANASFFDDYAILGDAIEAFESKAPLIDLETSLDTFPAVAAWLTEEADQKSEPDSSPVPQ